MIKGLIINVRVTRSWKDDWGYLIEPRGLTLPTFQTFDIELVWAAKLLFYRALCDSSLYIVNHASTHVVWLRCHSTQELGGELSNIWRRKIVAWSSLASLLAPVSLTAAHHRNQSAHSEQTKRPSSSQNITWSAFSLQYPICFPELRGLSNGSLLRPSYLLSAVDRDLAAGHCLIMPCRNSMFCHASVGLAG